MEKDRYLGGPPWVRGGIRVTRGGIESGQVRGSAGGLEKLSAGVSGLVKKTLDCTVHQGETYVGVLDSDNGIKQMS